MTAELIKEFLVLYEQKSFTKAARALFMTPSTLSRHIAAMEAELGVSLVIRSKSFFEITKEGTMLYQKGKKLVNDYDSMLWQIRNLSAQENNRLLLMGFPFQDQRLLACYRRFQNTYPDVELKVKILPLSENPELWESDKTSDTDLFLTLLFEDSSFPESYNRLILDQDYLCLILPPGAKEEIPENLQKWPFLAFQGSSFRGRNIERMNELVPGFAELYKAAVFYDETSLFFRLRQGGGFTILPGFLAAYYAPGCTIVPLCGEAGRMVLTAVWRRDNSNQHLFRFIQMAKESFFSNGIHSGKER